jgi:hypothetical protein
MSTLDKVLTDLFDGMERAGYSREFCRLTVARLRLEYLERANERR